MCYKTDEYQHSDIDIFIYGKRKTVVSNKIQEIYNYFAKKLNTSFIHLSICQLHQLSTSLYQANVLIKLLYDFPVGYESVKIL